MKLNHLLMLSLALFLTSCSTINETSKRQMEDGIYRVNIKGNKHHYIVAGEDTLTMHPAYKTKNGWVADTSSAHTILTDGSDSATRKPYTFVNHQPVFNVLSILFKYKPSTSGFPNQLLTNFNAAGYLGYGTNRYVLSYEKDPLNSYQRKMHYFGYSLGVFAGLGAPEITPSVLNMDTEIEYYGVVFTKGVAGVVNLGRLNFGLAVGIDHLMDKYKKFWIYQGKTWVGVVATLSLE